tara:strand:- start:231 stop:2981 length:2751 start_codon:yes stop_codon:yes gene_type:complete
MAGITQTIPQFTAGISEQPDHLKFPGQVKDVTNAIPDVTRGLYKRPGAKRVGTDKLTNVQSGGSWFHYYRDETEGSYIGQVAADGQVRVWRCNDGQLMTTSYTHNGVNHQTAVQNYLATSEPENLQFLTINDTTFVNSRDTTNANTLVGTTGTTDNTPDAHFGFIELIRTENGRQYGVDLNNSTHVTTVKRATRIKIQSDTLDEGNGTGNCPGIGTQVFSQNATGKTNLIFRLNTLGQQGISPTYNANSSGPGGNNYRCSYSREVVLLHGGEGWETGNTTTVTMEGFNYTILVEDHEETTVNATVSSPGDGLIRPAPTPFDADTAVTADTIIGGIIDQLPSGITGKHIGTGIYLSSANPFTVNVVEEDLMRCFQSSVNDVSNLPNQCKHGYIVKVSNALRAEEDDYYLRFEGENGKDGAGSWIECAKPSIAKELTNMPLVIQRTAATTFTVRPFDYQVRRVGDDTTNPMPSFVGSRINKVLFFRNRLALLSGENVITSRPGTLGLPDFFIETALTVSSADPIDISAASMFPSELFDGIEINTGLVVFSTNQQFLLASDDTVLNPDTAKLRSISTFNYNKDIAPISLGTTLGYVDNSGKFSRFNEMANIRREGEPNVVEVSKVVPTLLPKDIDLLTNSRENSMIFLGKTNSNIVFGYRYLNIGDQRQQAAWFKWKFNNPLLYHFIIDDEYFFLDTDHFLHTVKLVQETNDPFITRDNVNFLLHLDNYTTVSGGVYSSSHNITTFSGVGWLTNVTTPEYELAVISNTGRYGKPTVSTNSFTLPGDWSGLTLTIGYIYDYEVKIPRLYPIKVKDRTTAADVHASLIIHRVKLHFGKIGLYETTLKRIGKVDYNEVYESTQLQEYDVGDAPYLEEFIKTVPVYERNTNVDIILKSTHPAPATLRALSWEGDYSPRFYQRV